MANEIYKTKVQAQNTDELSQSICKLEDSLKAVTDKYESRGDSVPLELGRDLKMLKVEAH